MDGSVHSAATQQRAIRRVHDRVHLLPRDVTLNHLDAVWICVHRFIVRNVPQDGTARQTQPGLASDPATGDAGVSPARAVAALPDTPLLGSEDSRHHSRAPFHRALLDFYRLPL